MQTTSTEVFSGLFSEFFWLALAVAIFAVGWLVVSLVKFRHRPGRAEPKDAGMAGQAVHRGHRAVFAAFIIFPLATVVFLNVIDQGPLQFMTQPPPGEHLTVRVEGFQWGWRFIYPDGFETRELTVPLGRPVVLKVASRDVLHSFYIPAFSVKADAIPGQLNTLWFNATQVGLYRASCAEYCGLAHARMLANVSVMEPPQFDRWRAERARGAPS